MSLLTSFLLGPHLAEPTLGNERRRTWSQLRSHVLHKTVRWWGLCFGVLQLSLEMDHPRREGRLQLSTLNQVGSQTLTAFFWLTPVLPRQTFLPNASPTVTGSKLVLILSNITALKGGNFPENGVIKAKEAIPQCFSFPGDARCTTLTALPYPRVSQQDLTVKKSHFFTFFCDPKGGPPLFWTRD